jgi:geranyl-CoA carboxylase alpha subunit
MRRVERAEEFLEALASARAEAISAFGSGDVLLEPWVSVARHIEIQVLGDLHGHMVTLGERDCSVQRRHQKVVEEAPSPAVSAPLRLALEDAARRLALAASYANAGTVEFLVDDHDRFYFLEMNTRLQVEHPVTEEVTGIDLVELQLRVARGESLSALGPVIAQRGHSIEVRLYAEDPAQSFLPQTGIVQYWQPPAGDGVRVESGIESASIVSPYYDPMLAKIIATGANRDEARRRLLSAIERTILLGVGNNLTFLRSILSQEAFAQGDVTTSFLEESGLLRPVPIDDAGRSACLAAILCVERDARSVATEWKGWRSTGFAQTVVRLRSNKEVVDVQVEHRRNHYRVTRGSATMVVDVVEIGPHQLIWMEEGIRRSVPYAAQGNRVSLQLGTTATTWVDDTYAPPATIGSMGSGLIRSPTSGRVTRVLVQSGQKLAAGELVMVIEAMKMENHVCSPREGVVEELMAAPEDQVQGNQLLVKLVDILPKH